MVRATRSSAVQLDTDIKDKDSPPPTTRQKPGPKKRKRASQSELDIGPSPKQPRTDEEGASPDIKEEQLADLPDSPNQRPYLGELPLRPDDAQKILDILETMDTQGLLDRVFPLPEDSLIAKNAPSDPSSSKLVSNVQSLRSLLQAPQMYSLKALRSAISHLFPISSLPRTKISTPATQQLKFCQLAISLIDQASIRISGDISLEFPIHIPSIADSSEESAAQEEAVTAQRRRKYALMQRLPTGDWWTSLNSDPLGSPEFNSADVSSGHAEAVSILPYPSTMPDSIPTLGDLHLGKQVAKGKAPDARSVSCGTFLDYGPYASFAPTFDSNGAGVGRNELSGIIWRRYQKGKLRAKAAALREKILEEAKLLSTSSPAPKDVSSTNESMDVDEDQTIVEQPSEDKALDEPDLGDLVSPEMKQKLLTTQHTLMVEEEVQKILKNTAKALVRLEELQNYRLWKEGSPSSVASGSKELELAQKINETFVLLASLRPRSKTSESPFIPTKGALHVLQRTLANDVSQGWYGTLTQSRATALRDDSTILVKNVPVPEPAATPASTVPATPTTQTATPSYNANSTYLAAQNYSAYPNYSQYRSNYTYSTGQPTSYYPAATYQPPSTPQTTNGTAQYASSVYNATSQAAQYPYNANWYANYQQTASTSGSAAATGTNSGRGTPQPAASAATPTTYSSFFAANAASGGTTQAQTPTRAVANTVSAKPQMNGWAGKVGYTAPTLPTHLRPSQPASPAPGTPQTSYSASTYYKNYTQPQASGR